MAQSRVVFVFDEGLSDPMAEMLTHCGGKTDPVIEVQTLRKRRLLQTDDKEWIRKCVEKGWIPVSQDLNMVTDHDIASLAEELGATIFLLKAEITQQRRWELLRWYLNNLRKLARAVDKGLKPGNAWYVGQDAGLHQVKPSKRPARTCH